MQKIAGLAAVLFGLSAASALAQAPAEPPPPPKAPPEINASNPPPPPPGPKGPERDMGPRADMGHRPPPPPPRERGARFHIEDGRTRIDIRCADGEPTKACGDVVLQILDRLQTPSADDNKSDRNDRDRGYDRDRYERR